MGSPLTEPGLSVNNGENVKEIVNLYSYFANTVTKIRSLEVSEKSDGSDSRRYKVTPLATESAIRNRDCLQL